MQQTTGAEGRALRLYGGLRETLHKPQIARQSTNNTATGYNKSKTLTCKNLTGAKERAVNKLRVWRQRNIGEGKSVIRTVFAIGLFEAELEPV